MEGICGVFDSSIAASWVQALGTILAAIVAISIYKKGRLDQTKDHAKRRKVLHTMLRNHVIRAVHLSKTAKSQLDAFRNNCSHVDVGLTMLEYELYGIDRMIDLQAQLMNFGDIGDIELAAFIEDCMQYSKTHQGWLKQIFEDKTIQRDDTGYPLAFTAIGVQLIRMCEHADAAERAVNA